MNSDIALRPIGPSDLDDLFEHQRQPEANAMARFPARNRQDFDAHWRRILADATVTARAILYGGVLVGNVVSFIHEGKREVGYWVDRRYWGLGVATRALDLFLVECEERPLHAHVAGANRASIKVLEKCGFRRVGPADGSVAGFTDEQELDYIVE